jgi:phage baseplate assembly protein W
MSKLEGISVKLPLTYSPVDGPYILNKNLGEVVRQNLKNLLLTAPGERIMVPEFGAGLYGLLFENVGQSTLDGAVQRITTQVGLFMPDVNLENIEFQTSEDNPQIPLNQIQISIVYNISPYNVRDELRITSNITI